MRIFLAASAAVALTGCATSTVPPAASDAPPRVTQSNPATAPSMAPQDSILFWDADRRSAAFRAMQGYFTGLNVAPANEVRQLPEGNALSQTQQDALRAYMAKTDAAGLMVLQDGKVRFEDYGLGFRSDQRWTSFSVAKSFTSTLLGAAIRDGRIKSVDTLVTSILPELAGTAYDGVTVGQVATMTSGVAWNEDYSDPNSDVAKMLAVAPVAGESQAVTYAKSLSREAPAGEKWVYKTLETNLLGLLVERAVGMPLAEYAASKIVEPAGLEGGMFWMQDLTGGNIAGCCISLRLSDYARFGQFVLEGGGDVVPQGWFAEATAPQVSFAPRAPGFGYGYQWWTYPGGAFGAQGIFGQAVTIVPEKNLVVAVVSNWPTATSNAYRDEFRALVGELAASPN
ncbi:class C beta-lactamase-related serine hydrolase [Erythrobacter litoralis]|uniref:serine hydrolase domain-containing protein n=1 Tax=Erythrobacter litoralis TaxID=39960 RepID=UPI0024355352|nr:serine hydrolase [Erythrobacter litoralis]MDG6078305.1 class C beta-lactamase-related serine hydrolase [Erythrobacter litoralis]